MTQSQINQFVIMFLILQFFNVIINIMTARRQTTVAARRLRYIRSGIFSLVGIIAIGAYVLLRK